MGPQNSKDFGTWRPAIEVYFKFKTGAGQVYQKPGDFSFVSTVSFED